MHLRSPSSAARALLVRVSFTIVAACLAVGNTPAQAQSRSATPDSLTNAEFWAFFTSMSEADGSFLSENFVSNEVSFQDVIPTLQKSLTREGVYLGVGPEQNFTYIANLGPRMAVIFDIRRQNAMQHLMYKALFELSPTRAGFLARLFSRPSVARLGESIDVKTLFDSAAAAQPSDSAFRANFAAIVERLTLKRGFALPMEDIASIRHVFKVFFDAGPDVNYGYRSGNPGYVRSTYPTYGMLQSATNADAVQMAFLATEDNYRAVRGLQLKNLIVPVVGDFGGPSAIKAVAKWLREREMTVTAFYVSNVEQYLWRDVSSAHQFYSNVSAMPLDSTSRFIRSVPRSGGTMPMMSFRSSNLGSSPGTIAYTITRDATGNVITQTFRDSAGVTLVQTSIDSSGSRLNQTARDSAGLVRILETTRRLTPDSAARDTTAGRMLARRDSIIAAGSQWQIAVGRGVQYVVGGTLTSGLASIQETLKSFFLGELKVYQNVVEMTKVTGWR